MQIRLAKSICNDTLKEKKVLKNETSLCITHLIHHLAQSPNVDNQDQLVVMGIVAL